MDVDKIISKIQNGDFKEVKRFIKKNPETVNNRNSKGVTVLMAACEQGNKKLITLLTKSGADLNISDEDKKWTALHYAVEKHKTDVVAFLVSRGANVNKQNKWGNTPLHRAVVNKYEDVVKVLLNSKENNNLQVNQQNIAGATALHFACLFGQTNIVELLLQHNGIDVNAVNEDGWTVLHVACYGGHTDVVELLLQQNGIDVNAVKKDGSTPLHLASANGRKEVVDFLLQQNGIDANNVNIFGDTPLHRAVQEHKTDVVASLVSSGANVNKQDFWGNTPLHRAVENKYEDVVKVLLNSKENNNLQVNQGNIAGATVLHYACLFGQTNIVELLLQHNGIDVNAVTKYGLTPLHLASAHGHKEVVELLLQQNGIDAYKVDDFGDTPLHRAVQNHRYDVVASMLAQDSVKLDTENKDKRTPLLDAVSEAHIGIVHKLTTCGANINAVDKDGNNCLHIAAEKQEFCSEKEHITILDECCAKLGLPIEKRLSGVGVTCYLAHQGANLYRKNNKNVAPLDLIGDADLKEKFKELFPPQKCMLCEVNEASMELQPCAHTVLCEDCSKIQLKRCPKCKTCIESKRRVVCPKSEEKAVKMVAEAVECPKCKEKVKSFVCPKFEEKAVQAVAESVDSIMVKQIHLHWVSKKLGGKWQPLGRELEIQQYELDNIRHDYPLDVAEQGFQMLLKWHRSTDPEKRTLRILKAALKGNDCHEALECLPSEFN